MRSPHGGYESSRSIDDLAPPAAIERARCTVCGPGYRIGDEGCGHTAPESTPTEREAGDVGEVAAVLAAHFPAPVSGCECMPTDDETGQTEMLGVWWEDHAADVLAPLIAERERRAAEVALRPVRDIVQRLADDDLRYDTSYGAPGMWNLRDDLRYALDGNA